MTDPTFRPPSRGGAASQRYWRLAADGERDRDPMLFSFDLASLEDVSTHADAILHRLDAGTMPCDGAWPVERVAPLSPLDRVGQTGIGLRACAKALPEKSSSLKLVA